MQKVVFLVDMNAFFISCEMTRNPDLVGRPAAVAGDPKKRSGIVLAANYEARRYGIKTTMVLHDALRLCPNIVIVPPDHRFYEQQSRGVMSLLSRYTPLVEQNSIDEAWLDMTGCELLFGKPLDAAKLILNCIKDELGLWCSIGISYNKFLSKMASDMKKPLGITELWEEDISTKLWPLPLQSMVGIGNKTAEKLMRFGINTIGELANSQKDYISKKLGKNGTQIHQLANGYDTSAVTAHIKDDIKSIGRSTTLPTDISDIDEAKKIILSLAEEVGRDARAHDKKGRTVQLTIKYNDFQVITRQTTIIATYLTKEIYSAGFQLLEKNWSSVPPARLVGINISSFNENCEMDQISFFQLQQEPFQSEKEEKLERTMDAIRHKHGSMKISRAVLIPNKDDSIDLV